MRDPLKRLGRFDERDCRSDHLRRGRIFPEEFTIPQRLAEFNSILAETHVYPVTFPINHVLSQEWRHAG